MTGNTNPENVVREIRRKARRKYSTEEKIRIVLEGLRGEESIVDESTALYRFITTPPYSIRHHHRK